MSGIVSWKTLVLFTFELKDDFIQVSVMEDVPKELLPVALFGPTRDQAPDKERLISWLESRVVPVTHNRITQILESFGLKEYNLWKLLQHTEGRRSNDFYWITMI